jgi:hypothetical protein
MDLAHAPIAAEVCPRRSAIVRQNPEASVVDGRKIGEIQ